MQQQAISQLGWMNKYRTEIACVNEFARRVPMSALRA